MLQSPQLTKLVDSELSFLSCAPAAIANSFEKLVHGAAMEEDEALALMRQQAADYLHSMAVEMESLSWGLGFNMAAYLLGMVVLELDDWREGGCQPQKGPSKPS